MWLFHFWTPTRTFTVFCMRPAETTTAFICREAEAASFWADIVAWVWLLTQLRAVCDGTGDAWGAGDFWDGHRVDPFRRARDWQRASNFHFSFVNILTNDAKCFIRGQVDALNWNQDSSDVLELRSHQKGFLSKILKWLQTMNASDARRNSWYSYMGGRHSRVVCV